MILSAQIGKRGEGKMLWSENCDGKLASADLDPELWGGKEAQEFFEKGIAKAIAKVKSNIEGECGSSEQEDAGSPERRD